MLHVHCAEFTKSNKIFLCFCTQVSFVMSLGRGSRLPPESNRVLFCALFHWNSEQSRYYRKSIVNPAVLLSLSGNILVSITWYLDFANCLIHNEVTLRVI
jgi:hypothetical protein